MKRTYKRLITAFCVVCLITVLGQVSLQSWFYFQAHDAVPSARPAIIAVLKAQFWSELIGGYWDDELGRQQTYVSSLPLQGRLDYYRVLILNCDLGTSRGLVFINSLGADAESLHNELVNYKATIGYRKLPIRQQKKIDGWIEESSMIAQRRKANPSIKPE